MKNTPTITLAALEQRVERKAQTLWSESASTARRFALGVLNLDIPVSAKRDIVADAVAIGDALYQTTVFDYDVFPNGLELSRLSAKRPSGRSKYSAYTMKAVSELINNSHCGETSRVGCYLSEFYQLPEVRARLQKLEKAEIAA